MVNNDMTMNVEVRYVGDFPDTHVVIEAGGLESENFEVRYKGKIINNCRRIELDGVKPMFDGDTFNWRKRIEGENYGKDNN